MKKLKRMLCILLVVAIIMPGMNTKAYAMEPQECQTEDEGSHTFASEEEQVTEEIPEEEEFTTESEDGEELVEDLTEETNDLNEVEDEEDFEEIEEEENNATPETSFTWDSTDPNKITKYNGKDANIVIPARATAIGEGAFKGNTSIKTLSLKGSNVTYIGRGAFVNCTGLTSVTLNDVLQQAEYDYNSVAGYGWAHTGPFFGCTSLTTVTFDANSTVVPSYLFAEAFALKTVNFGSKITTIGSYAFENCTGLTTLTFPASLQSVNDHAFVGCKGVKSLVIPKNVTIIGANAFYNMAGVKTLSFESGSKLTTIKQRAFAYMTGITEVTIPASVSSVEYDYDDVSGYGWVSTGPFFGCSSLTTVNLEAGMTSVPAYLCADLFALKTINFGSKITSIGRNAFENCTGLTTLSLPASLQNVEAYAFTGCKGIKTLVIPKNVTSIGAYAFYNMPGVKTLSFEAGSKLSTIKQLAFAYMTGITEVTIPSTVSSVSSDYTEVSGYGWVHTGPFFGCSSLKTVSFEAGTTRVPAYLFADVFALTTINFGSSITSIGENAFENCTGLTTLTLPASLQTVNSNAFVGCKGVKSLVIPKNVTNIGAYAFCSMTGVKSLTFEAGSKLSQIGMLAFSYMTGITEVTLPAAISSCGQDSSYEDGGWIYKGPFNGCSQLTKVTFSEGTSRIPVYVCSNLTSLEKVVMPNSVTYIGDRAFYNCNGLEGIQLSENLVEIGGSVFAGCSGLTTINLPTKLTTLGRYSLANCSRLKNVNCGPNISDLPYYPENLCSGSSQIVFKVVKDSTSDKTFKAYGYENVLAYAYAINYNLNGGVNSPSNPNTFSKDEVIKLANPTKTGYNFAGWYTNANFTGDKVTTVNTSKTETVNLYAKWVAATYTVTVKPVGGTVNATSIKVTYGSTYGNAVYEGGKGLPSITLQDGYTFDGWYTTDATPVQITANTKVTITKNTTITNHVKKNDVILVFNANGGTGKMPNQNAKCCENTVVSANQFSKLGFNFVSWNDKPDGSGNEYKAGKAYDFRVKKTNTKITLYAQWLGEEYKVTLNSNNGSANSTIKVNYSSTFAGAKDVNNKVTGLPTPTKSGYAFVGWYTAPQPTSGEVEAFEVKNETVVNGSYAGTTLYAWYKAQPNASIISAPEIYVEENGVLTSEKATVTAVNNIKVSIVAANANEIIYFTTDGTSPASSSTRVKYVEIFTIKNSCTLKAVVYKDGKYGNESKKTITITKDTYGDIDDNGDLGALGSDKAAGLNNINDTIWIAYKGAMYDETKVSVGFTGASVQLENYRVYYGTTLLKEGVDYTVRYANNVKAADYNAVNAKNVSIAPTIIITGRGNFAGSLSKTFTIKAATEATKLTPQMVVIDPIKESYTGKEVKPAVKISLKATSSVLVAGTDYDLYFKNNVNASKNATVRIVFKGKYFGEITKKFEITKADLSGAKVTGKSKVTFTKKGVNPEIVVKVNDNTLKVNVDYTLKPAFNKKTGLYDVTINGKGNYAGKTIYSYTLESCKLNDNKAITTTVVPPVASTKAGVFKPTYLVVYENGVALALNKDYKVSYLNADLTPVDPKKVFAAGDILVVVIEGIGNYTGTTQVGYRILESYKMSEVKMTVGNVEYQNKAGILKPAVTLVGKNGKKLAVNKDYEKNIVYTYVEDTAITSYNKATKKISSSIAKANTVVGPTDIIPAGTVIKATVTGCGCYNGSISATFKVATNIAKTKAVIAAECYNGNYIIPTKENIKVTLGKEVLKSGDYEIVSVTANKSKGTATVIITGIGKYHGVKKVTFKINPKKL